MKKSAKRWFVGLVSVTASVAIVCWLLYRIDFEKAAALIAAADVRWLAVALVCTIAVPFSTTSRWLGVLSSQPDCRLSFREAMRAVLMANILNSFLPSKSGDIAKAIYLRRRAGVAKGLGTVIVERVVDLSLLGLLGIVGWSLSGSLWGLVAGASLLTAMAAVVIVALYLPLEKLPLPQIAQCKLMDARSIFPAWFSNSGAMLRTIAGSVATWTMAGLTICALTSALRLDLEWGYAFGIFPVAILAGLTPFTISGIGVRDSALVFLLSTKVSVEGATLVGLGYTVFGYWLLSLISLPVVGVELFKFLRRSPEFIEPLPERGVVDAACPRDLP